MQLIGHRGGLAHGPGNTIETATRAAPYVDMIEIDVQRCGTGELVVFHDTTLDRLTAVSRPVAVTDWDTLSTLTVDGSDAQIPLLSDVLSSIPIGVGVNIELKHAGMAADLERIVSKHENEILYSSFVPQALAEIDGSYNRGYLFSDLWERPDGWSSRLDMAEGLGCTAIHPEYTLLTQERVAQAHERGLAVHAWTVPSTEMARKLHSMGVDGIIVDDWDVFE